jgi:hypothetical protein
VLDAVALVADLDRSRLWLWRADPGCAKPVASEAWDWLLVCNGGGEAAERGDADAENSVDFGRPMALGPGEGEAFLANGLLRTDMASCQSSATERNHGMLQVSGWNCCCDPTQQSCKH